MFLTAMQALSICYPIQVYIHVYYYALQNNVTRLDDVTHDPSGFFVTADYVDHIKSCTR